MLARIAACTLTLALAGCSIVGTDGGSFDATLTGALSQSLTGSAVMDAQDSGVTILLFPEGLSQSSEIRIAIARADLRTGTLSIGPDVAAGYILRNGPSGGSLPDQPGPSPEAGTLVFNATAGTVDLTAVGDDTVEGRFELTTTNDERDDDLSISGTFRAVSL